MKYLTCLTFVLLFSSMACTHHQIVPSPSALFLKDPTQMIKQIQSRNERILAMSANAQINLETETEKHSFDEIILAALPARLRLETVTFLGNTVGLVVSNGKDLSIYVPGEKKIYTGTASSENLSHILPLKVEVSEITDLLLTRIRLIDYDGVALDFDRDIQRYRLRLHGKEQHLIQEILLDIDLNVRAVKYGKKDDFFLLAQYDQYESQTIAFPKKVKFLRPKENTNILIRYHDVEINPAINDAYFSFTPPKGVQEISLDDSPYVSRRD